MKSTTKPGRSGDDKCNLQSTRKYECCCLWKGLAWWDQWNFNCVDALLDAESWEPAISSWTLMLNLPLSNLLSWKLLLRPRAIIVPQWQVRFCKFCHQVQLLRWLPEDEASLAGLFLSIARIFSQLVLGQALVFPVFNMLYPSFRH